MKWFILSVLFFTLLLAPTAAGAGNDVYYFHDSGRNGIWDNQWNPGAGFNCDPSMAGGGEYMDCLFPDGVECVQTPVYGGLAGGPLCYLELPGCAAGNYPAGNWTANLWLTATEPDSIAVQLWVVPCNNLCPVDPQWIALASGAINATDQCTLLSIPIQAPAFALTDSTRLMLEIYSDNWGRRGVQSTSLCWNAQACASNLTAPASVFCTTPVERTTWGRIKDTYR